MLENNLSPPRAWAEVNAAALVHNYGVLKTFTDEAEMMAVVKANGYGHGVINVYNAIERFSPRFYGVANVAEARELADVVAPSRIYLLGSASPLEYREIVAYGFVPCVSSIQEAKAYSEVAVSLGKTLSVHIAIDTGMGRGGFLPESEELRSFRNQTFPSLSFTGIGSHFAVADEDEQFTNQQLTRFENALRSLPSFEYRHIANSAGTIMHECGVTNLYRPGLALYGISPDQEHQAQLKPAMTLKSRISIIRQLPTGSSVSYGRTFVTSRPTEVATVGIGYGDGYHRTLSGKNAEVAINGARCPIIGRVTMDQIMVDVTDLPNCQPDDEAELFGNNILITELATKANTIPWELFTSISQRVSRVLV